MQIGSCMNAGYYMPYQSNVGVKKDATMVEETQSEFEQSVWTGAVSITEMRAEGEILGITMVPEEGESVIYGMKAILSNKSTHDNPIVQVVSNLGGEQVIYDVEVNKVNPKNATQLEMFALLSYTDKMGITDRGTFGSHQRLEVYSKNASELGYCNSLSGKDAFLNERFDWASIMEKMIQVYQEAGITNQSENCEELFDFLDEYTSQNEQKIDVKADFERLVSNYANKVKQVLEEGEPSYQIGSQSFSEKEWDAFLDKFDAVEEVIKDQMKEEQERREEMEEAEMLLTTQSTSCLYETANPDNNDIRYITWYTEEGIFCRKAGQTEGYGWIIPFESAEQYNKVIEFIEQFPSDWNMRFAAHENFWNDFLNNEIDMDDFMEFMNGTNKGVPDFSMKIGDSTYIDKNKIQWAKYTNPLGARFYTAEEMQQMQREIIAANQAKLTKLNNVYVPL